ncbi:conserved hypothetical protein, partial [Trichinella spiralis]|uniref:hypothetical protein n=1 Tax=Trichinella spiralis TaxID=6334 RepID=UPI0001EFD26E
MTSTYSCQRMTARWPLVIFYNIIDVSAYNAYVLWTEKHPAWNVGRLHKRRLFLEELGKALVQPEMMRRKTLPRTAAAKSAVKRLRKDTEQPSTSGITDTDAGGKKRARCQLCVQSDNKTSSQYDRKTNCASLMGQFDPEDNGRTYTFFNCYKFLFYELIIGKHIWKIIGKTTIYLDAGFAIEPLLAVSNISQHNTNNVSNIA